MSMDTMNNNPNDSDKDDEQFEHMLKLLHRRALLNEDFQQQVVQDLRSLSPEAQAALHEPHQAFVRDESLSNAARERLLALLPAAAQTAQPVNESTKLSLWQRGWQALLGHGERGRLIPSLMIAGVVGVVCVPLLITYIDPTPSETVRGGGSTDVVQPDQPMAVDEYGLTDQIREEQPQQWLNVIAQLLEQGKINAAQQQWTEFALQHADHAALLGAPQHAPTATDVREHPQQWLDALVRQLRQGDLALFKQEFSEFVLANPNYRPVTP